MGSNGKAFMGFLLQLTEIQVKNTKQTSTNNEARGGAGAAPTPAASDGGQSPIPARIRPLHRGGAQARHRVPQQVHRAGAGQAAGVLFSPSAGAPERAVRQAQGAGGAVQPATRKVHDGK